MYRWYPPELSSFIDYRIPEPNIWNFRTNLQHATCMHLHQLIRKISNVQENSYCRCNAGHSVPSVPICFIWSKRDSGIRSDEISYFSDYVAWYSEQCFGSIFIESGSGSSRKSQSGSRKALKPDPDPSYFFTLSEKKLKLFHYYKFLWSKEVN